MRTDLALAALASAAVPGMKPVTVAGIGPGDDERGRELQSALVEDATGRRWVVRAPLTPVAGAQLQRNDELVRQLSRHVPFKVPAAAGYAPVGKDGAAAVYPYVEGSPLDLRRLPAGPGLASAVGRALAAVHNIPRAVFEEQDVPVFDASGARQRAIAEVDRAAETGRVPTGLLARWEEAFEAAPLWQFATTPVHGAFTGGSVVVAFTDEADAATGRVVAVTDWDEAMVGDPAVDLAELWSQSSRQAWEAVLDSYTLARTHRPDPYLHARARLVAELRNLRGLALAVAEDDEDTARRAVETLRRMDRLTEADDSLVPVTARPSGARAEAPVVPAEPIEHRGDEGAGAADAGGPDGGAAATLPAAPGPEADPTMEVPPPQVVGTGRDDTAEPAPSPGSVDATGPAAREDEPLARENEPDEDATTWIDRPAPPAMEPHRTDQHEVGPAEDRVVGERDADAEETSESAEQDLPVTHDVPGGPEHGGAGHDLTHEQVIAADGPTPDGPAGSRVEQVPAAVEGPRDEGDGPTAEGDSHRAEAQRPAMDEPLPAVAEQDVEELEDEARLHELYGMPVPERDTEDR